MNMNIHRVKKVLLENSKYNGDNNIMRLRIISNDNTTDTITLFMDDNVKNKIKTVKEF